MAEDSSSLSVVDDIGYDSGFEDGYDVGHSEGYAEGLKLGFQVIFKKYELTPEEILEVYKQYFEEFDEDGLLAKELASCSEDFLLDTR